MRQDGVSQPFFWMVMESEVLESDLALVDEFIESAVTRGVWTFDVEHPPECKPHDSGFRLSGVSIATADHCLYLREFAAYSKVIRTLFREDIEAVAYNGKYDLKCLVAAGVIDCYEYPKRFCDPMVAVNLLDDNRRPNQLGLKSVVYDVFEHTMVNFNDAWSHGEDSEEFAAYAKEDAYWELKLWLKLKPKLEKEKLLELFQKIVCPVSMVFADMETAGIGWDLKGARTLLHGFQKLREEKEKSIREIVGDINLRSGDQLSQVLFHDLGLPTRGVPPTASGKRLSVDAKVMDRLASKHPVCADIRTWRTCDKMISTYVEPLTRKALADPDGRIHPTFWVVSSTGRTRSDDPNFQNIPAWLGEQFAHLSIRKNVIAGPGRVLLVADLSQIELRMVAHISGDRLFLKAYRDWKCTSCGSSGSEDHVLFHVCPVCGCGENEKILTDASAEGFYHGADIHQQTCDLVPALAGSRQNGKRSNFALVYYATARMMNFHYPDLSIAGWEEVIEGYFGPRAYHGVRAWHSRMEYLMESRGVCTDVFGRKRRIPRDVIRRNWKHALNQFINFGPQASACGLIELHLIRLKQRWMEDGSWMREVFPTNFVHDEIVLEVPENKVDVYRPVVEEVMESGPKFKVPIRTGIEIVERWGDAK